ncbi:MAG: DUF3300 domain-containing protein [Candidatus Eiseniibacteriota bacterium]
MPGASPYGRPIRLAVAASALVLFAACSKGKETSSTQATSATSQTSDEPSETLVATSTTWTPEAMEELLAPVALYPDPVLLQVLTAATNPQEVLDAGNWLIANPNLEGKALEDAAEKAGFTVPVRGLIQAPSVIDQMCMNLSWTEEVGQAYVNDQQGVMDAVQRLRAQAQSVGTLASSDKMKVETKEEGGQEVITVSPPSPQVVYVPTYDPVAAYAPQTSSPPPSSSSNDSDDDDGSALAGALLGFGMGIMVAEVFDHDDYYGPSYYGGMWGHPMPYYPPYPYRPVYGGGFYPAHAYNRPNVYVRNNTNININSNNNYWNRQGGNSRDRNRANPKSPISEARPNRPELNQLNADAKKGPKRKGPSSSEALKGKGGYAGADSKTRDAASRSRAGASAGTNVGGKRAAPKVQGTYAGAKPNAQGTGRVGEARAGGATSKATPGRSTVSTKTASSRGGQTDRGYAGQSTPRRSESALRPAQSASSRPAQSASTQPQVVKSRPTRHTDNTAVGGVNHGSADRAASARGRQSSSSSGTHSSGTQSSTRTGGGGGRRGR